MDKVLEQAKEMELKYRSKIIEVIILKISLKRNLSSKLLELVNMKISLNKQSWKTP